MRRLSVGLVALAVMGGLALPAVAEQQPTRAINAVDRNGGASAPGPHCHVNLVASAHARGFDTIMTGAIHQAHVVTGLSGAVFQADGDCVTPS